MSKKKIIVVVGGQYGSESKGLVVGSLARERYADICIRTGSVNAGHTVMYKGKPYVNQLIPVGWVQETADLVIGAGAYVEQEALDREATMITEATGQDVRERLFIDFRCGLHGKDHAKRESGLHERMGSTGKGCSEAIKDKMDRGFDYQLFAQTEGAKGYKIVDTVKMLNDAYDSGSQLLIEGTQGALLDLHMGHFPYVTSRQTQAAAWISECGLSPSLEYEVVLVCRTIPIRVAGNSGYMGTNEYSWPELARTLNAKCVKWGLEPIVDDGAIQEFVEMEASIAKTWRIPNPPFNKWPTEYRVKYSEQLVNIHRKVLSQLSEATVAELKKFFEITTVTKKLRRIAELDIPELKHAIQLNRPQYIVLNFLNYLFPTCRSCENASDLVDCPEWQDIATYIKNLEDQVGVPVRYVNTNPNGIIEL